MQLEDLPREIHLEIAQWTCAGSFAGITGSIAADIDMASLSRLARTSKYWRALINLKSPRFITPRELARRQLCVHLRQDAFLRLLDKVTPNIFMIEQYVTAVTVHKYFMNRPSSWDWTRVTLSPCLTIHVLLELVKKYNIDATTRFILDTNSNITGAELRRSGLDINLMQSKSGLRVDDLPDLVDYYQRFTPVPDGLVFEIFARRAKISHDDLLTLEDKYKRQIGGGYLACNPNIPIDVIETRILTSDKHLMSEESTARLKRDSKKWPELQEKLIADDQQMSLSSLFSKYFDLGIIQSHPDYPWKDDIIALRDLPVEYRLAMTTPEHSIYGAHWTFTRTIVKLYERPSDKEIEYIEMYNAGKLDLETMISDKSVNWNWEFYFDTCSCINPPRAIIAVMSRVGIYDITYPLVSHPDFTIDLVFEFPMFFWNLNDTIRKHVSRLINASG